MQYRNCEMEVTRDMDTVFENRVMCECATPGVICEI